MSRNRVLEHGKRTGQRDADRPGPVRRAHRSGASREAAAVIGSGYDVSVIGGSSPGRVENVQIVPVFGSV
jgi:hypothetical protein